MTRRDGFTIVEISIAAVLIAVVLGTVFNFLSSTRRMNDAARGSEAVAAALLIEESIAMDMRQLGVDPARPRVFEIGRDGLSFYRTVFAGKAIRLRPVRYSVRKLRSGNFRMERTEIVQGKLVKSQLEGILGAIAFGTTRDKGSSMTYLKVSMTVLPDDVPPASGVDPHGVAQVLLARIPVPVQLVNPELAPSCALTPEANLLPLESLN